MLENPGSAPSLPRDPGTHPMLRGPVLVNSAYLSERSGAAPRHGTSARRGVARLWQGPSVRGTGSMKAVVICLLGCRSAARLQRLLTENFTAEWIVSVTLRLWGLLWGNLAVL